MLRAPGRSGWFWELGAALAVFAAAGCTGEVGVPVAQNRVVGAVPEAEMVMAPLSAAPDTDPAPETTVALAPDVTVEARLLVITADGTSPSFAAITATLGYLGTPYDVLNATTGPALTADYLAVGDHGRYYGILLDTGDLAVGSSSAFSAAEWMTLASYETRFGVRRAVMYAIPTASYGLQMNGGFDARTAPLAAQCTTAGSIVFVGANCGVPVAIADGFAYSAQPIDAFTLPLLVDTAGNVYAAVRSYADGREALVLTFSQSPSAFHTLELAYGVVNWVTHGLFVGERHVYVSPQIDDFFLASEIYPGAGATYRITAADLTAFLAWQKARRADSLTAQLRSTFAFNAAGAKPRQSDGLVDEALGAAASFTWINHTWAHHVMTSMSYADASEAILLNNQYAKSVGLAPYSVENLVTPEISGLDNPEAMRAVFDVGVRQLVTDTSVAGQANPSPNAGYYNAQAPGLLSIPRRPTDVYYNVSQPAEWMAEYAALHGAAASYDQMIATVSDSLARYLLRGENDPWMFHQANLRDNGGGKSLLSDVLDATLAKYAARATFPVVSPTMDDLAQKVKARMSLDASGVSATIEPGSKLTVRVTKAATVPVTGLCTPSAEAYGGRQISYLQLAAGQAVTFSLTDCNGGMGGGSGTGAGGASGAGGTIGSGSGGSDGTGAGGRSGETGAGGDGTTGHLSTDGSTSPGSPDTGWGCLISGGGPKGGAGGAGAGALLTALVFAIAGRGRWRRRWRCQPSWATR